MYHHFSILIILFFSVVSLQSIAHDDKISFAVDLIHRDSPESPFYDRSSLTPSELLSKGVMRSHARVYGLNSSSAYMDDIRNYYTVRYYLGSNKVPAFLYVDLTGSFVWTKCNTVSDRDNSLVLYDPSLSSSFSEVGFDSLFCNSLSADIKIPKTSGECSFKYKDPTSQAEAYGVIMNDIFYFSESQTDAQKIYFGCDNSIRRDEYDTGLGLFGLGRGPFSFISQLQNVTNYKFSYCLLAGSSKIVFGNLPKEIERVLVPSPLQHKLGNVYYLNLESVEVGDSPIDEPFRGGMIRIRIDFGRKWTFLEDSVYRHVVDRVREIIKAVQLPVPIDHGLCYKKKDLKGKEFPLVFHFEGKVSIKINSSSVFAQDLEGRQCMIIRKTNEHHSIFGSLAQMGQVMQFDLKKQQVSFAPMNCSLF